MIDKASLVFTLPHTQGSLAKILTILSFYDINPEAKIHVLVVPKTHITSANEINSENSNEISYIFEKIPQIASLVGISNGYRIITNSGPDSCQSVMHLHFHILGGEKLPEHII